MASMHTEEPDKSMNEMILKKLIHKLTQRLYELERTVTNLKKELRTNQVGCE